MLTREDIAKYMTISDSGMITSPGMFEGEPVYVPHYWDVYLNGFADNDDGKVLSFVVTEEQKTMFPELGDTVTVELWQSDNGFVFSDAIGANGKQLV